MQLRLPYHPSADDPGGVMMVHPTVCKQVQQDYMDLCSEDGDSQDQDAALPGPSGEPGAATVKRDAYVPVLGGDGLGPREYVNLCSEDGSEDGDSQNTALPAATDEPGAATVRRDAYAPDLGGDGPGLRAPPLQLISFETGESSKAPRLNPMPGGSVFTGAPRLDLARSGTASTNALRLNQAPGGSASTNAPRLNPAPSGTASTSAPRLNPAPGGSSANALRLSPAPAGPAFTNALRLSPAPGGPASTNALGLSPTPGGTASADAPWADPALGGSSFSGALEGIYSEGAPAGAPPVAFALRTPATNDPGASPDAVHLVCLETSNASLLLQLGLTFRATMTQGPAIVVTARGEVFHSTRFETGTRISRMALEAIAVELSA